MRDRIIWACVKHIRAFGYPACTPADALTDRCYRSLAKQMLVGTIGDCGENNLVGRTCLELIAEIDACAAKEASDAAST